MSALTAEERRRIFLARQQADRVVAVRLAEPIAASERLPRRHRRLNPVLKAAMLAALLGTGWLAYRVVEFHPPTSIEQMVPRL